MTEPEKIKVNKPTGYLEMPIEANGAMAAAVPVFPTGPNGGGTGEIASTIIHRPAKSLGLRPSEDAKDPSGDLIEAAGTVYRLLTAKIAFHEREAQKLREALAPFATHARQSAAPVAPSDDEALDAFLRVARTLQENQT